jgi:uncharacterized protein YhaN
MKLNFLKSFSTVARWMVAALLCVSAMTFVWQGVWFSDSAALAEPTATLIASSNDVQEKAREDAGRTKSFVRETADKLERTAYKNADRVDDATDNGSAISRKAQRDAARIEKRAEEDAARTQKAIDNTKNVVERAVDNIKDTFSN